MQDEILAIIFKHKIFLKDRAIASFLDKANKKKVKEWCNYDETRGVPSSMPMPDKIQFTQSLKSKKNHMKKLDATINPEDNSIISSQNLVKSF